MNQKLPDNANWVNCGIEDDYVSYNKYHQPLYFKCHWCGGISLYLITRTYKASSHTYIDHCCEQHAKEWGLKNE